MFATDLHTPASSVDQIWTNILTSTDLSLLELLRTTPNRKYFKTKMICSRKYIKQIAVCVNAILVLGPLLLAWINFNLSMNK